MIKSVFADLLFKAWDVIMKLWVRRSCCLFAQATMYSSLWALVRIAAFRFQIEHLFCLAPGMYSFTLTFGFAPSRKHQEDQNPVAKKFGKGAHGTRIERLLLSKHMHLSKMRKRARHVEVQQSHVLKQRISHAVVPALGPRRGVGGPMLEVRVARRKRENRTWDRKKVRTFGPRLTVVFPLKASGSSSPLQQSSTLTPLATGCGQQRCRLTCCRDRCLIRIVSLMLAGDWRRWKKDASL